MRKTHHFRFFYLHESTIENSKVKNEGILSLSLRGGRTATSIVIKKKELANTKFGAEIINFTNLISSIFFNGSIVI